MSTHSYVQRRAGSQVQPSNKFTRCLYKWRRGVQCNRSPKFSQAFKIQTFVVPIQKQEPEVLRSLELEVPSPGSTVRSLPVSRLHTQVSRRQNLQTSRFTPVCRSAASPPQCRARRPRSWNLCWTGKGATPAMIGVGRECNVGDKIPRARPSWVCCGQMGLKTVPAEASTALGCSVVGVGPSRLPSHRCPGIFASIIITISLKNYHLLMPLYKTTPVTRCPAHLSSTSHQTQTGFKRPRCPQSPLLAPSSKETGEALSLEVSCFSTTDVTTNTFVTILILMFSIIWQK